MKTKAQKYNDKMDKLFDPEIARLKKVEQIAKEVLTKIESLSVVCYVGDKCHVINAIQRILSEKTNLK